MAGDEPPFLYDPPSERRTIAFPYSDFNPRAATQAHHAALADRAEHQRAKLLHGDKPLISFNQHPDSYMIVGSHAPQYDPMPTYTKTLIASLRWAQMVLRILQEIGALGMLVCFICLKMKLDSQGWILRIAPAWDSVISLYAIYHLIRPARGRTPATSGSYHFFALFMDTGIIPFYVFIVLLSNQNYTEDPSVDGRWTSFFANQQTTNLLIFVTYIGGMALSGLHFVSIGLDLYLVVMFRRIANLPPDMNPLEDNLTRRPSRTHKHKNSEMTMSSESLSEKKAGYYSAVSLTSDGSRLSTAKSMEARVVPFGQTRTGANKAFSPHNPETARMSRQAFEAVDLYAEKMSGRSPRQDEASERPARPASLNSSKHGSFHENLDDEPAHPSDIDAFLSPDASHIAHFANPVVKKTRQPQNLAPAQSQLLSDNWYAFGKDEGEIDMGTRQPKYPPASAYTRLPMHDRHDSFEPQPQPQQQPLKMNPPTPVNAIDNTPKSPDSQRTVRQSHRYQAMAPEDDRTMTMGSQASTIQASSVYSDDVPSIRSGSKVNAGTPKGKYYGDLTSASRGVRGNPVSQRPLGARGSPVPSSAPHSPPKGRVVSRSGVDITDAAESHYSSDNLFRVPRRRDVSGKTAEEGRGGWNVRPR